MPNGDRFIQKYLLVSSNDVIFASVNKTIKQSAAATVRIFCHYVIIAKLFSITNITIVYLAAKLFKGKVNKTIKGKKRGSLP